MPSSRTGAGALAVRGLAAAGHRAAPDGQSQAGGRPPPEGHPLATADSYARLGPVLRGYLRRWVPTDDVDDVVQAAFVDLWRTRARYDPARSLEAWAMSIARRRAIDHLRSRPRPTAPLETDRCGEDGREVASRLADAAAVRGALSALPPPQREAIALAYYGGLSQREIAERLRVPVGTVKARTARGLHRVRRMLAEA